MIAIKVSDKIVLQQIVPSDAEELFETIDAERVTLREWLPFVDHTRKPGDSRDFIKSLYEEGSREMVWVIRYEAAFAGMVGLKSIDYANRRCEIGYWLSGRYRKKGVMTESVQALVAYSFENLNMNRIQIRCAVENKASSNIPKRAGFALEGTERDGELLSAGQYVDLEVYSLVKRLDGNSSLRFHHPPG